MLQPPAMSAELSIMHELDQFAPPAVQFPTKCGEALRRHRCDRCMLVFGSWDELRLHKRSHPRLKRRHPCDMCDKDYSKLDYLRRHMLKDHNVELAKGGVTRKSKHRSGGANDPKPYKCSECIREFSKYKPYNRHLKTHVKRYCELCQEYVPTYAEHLRKMHGQEVPRNFLCDICNRSYRTKNDIVVHMRMHVNVIENITIPCKLCERSFYFNHDLRRHMRSHSQLRPIICDICGESFKTGETLKTHMRRHTGEKPFQCTLCPKSFSTSGSLHIHVRTHTNERPHECTICHKAFKDASTMKVHVRQHTGDSPYCCHLCGRRTKQASNLRSHYRHFHKNTEITGRQIRQNARVFARYAQAELDEELRCTGDLVTLLSRGMEEYLAEQNANQEAEEQKRQRLGINELLAQSIPKEERVVSPPVSPSPSPVPRRLPAVRQKASSFTKLSDDHMSFEAIETLPNTDIKLPMDHMLSMKSEMDSNIIFHSMFAEQEQQFEVKPALSIINVESHFIESVYVDDDFVNDANTTDSLKVEKMDYEYDDLMQYNQEASSPMQLEGLSTMYEDMAPTRTDEDANSDFDWVDDMAATAASESEESSSEKPVPKASPTDRKPKLKYTQRSAICFACDIAYSNRDEHLSRYHSELIRPYECFICHKDYKRLYALRQHMLIHFNERNTICHICGNSYFNNSDLRKHILSAHTTDRPFRCEHCGKTFKTQYGVTVHARIHTGQKPFQCNVCQELFAAPASLRTHMRRHTGEKPFVCKYCDKGFSDSSTHRQHERVHSGEKPYKCHLCDRRTVQAGNLKSHYRHFHKLIVKNVTMFVDQ